MVANGCTQISLVKILWIVFISFFTMGLVPIYDRHDSQEKIDEEFRNIYLNAQSRKFTFVTSTPTSLDMQEGELIVFSSGVIKLILFDGTTTYQVIFSSISTLSK